MTTGRSFVGAGSGTRGSKVRTKAMATAKNATTAYSFRFKMTVGAELKSRIRT